MKQLWIIQDRRTRKGAEPANGKSLIFLASDLTIARQLCKTWTKLRASRPLRIKALAVVERLLRADTSRRQSRVEIGAAHGFLFWHAFSEKYREAPDERVTRPGAVDTLHREWRNLLASSRVASRDPCDPSVMITRRMPPARSFAAHFFASSTFFTGNPVMVSASLSFGTK